MFYCLLSAGFSPAPGLSLDLISGLCRPYLVWERHSLGVPTTLYTRGATRKWPGGNRTKVVWCSSWDLRTWHRAWHTVSKYLHSEWAPGLVSAIHSYHAVPLLIATASLLLHPYQPCSLFSFCDLHLKKLLAAIQLAYSNCQIRTLGNFTSSEIIKLTQWIILTSQEK